MAVTDNFSASIRNDTPGASAATKMRATPNTDRESVTCLVLATPVSPAEAVLQ